MTDLKELALCDRDGCNELARYVETGDGRAVRDPKRRCHGHKPSGGLWRDLAVAVGRDVHREPMTDGGEEPEPPECMGCGERKPSVEPRRVDPDPQYGMPELCDDCASEGTEPQREPRTDGGLEPSAITYRLSDEDADADALTPEYVQRFADLNPNLRLESATFRLMTDGTEDGIPAPEFPEDGEGGDDL